MLFANNCNTTLNGGITAVATSLVVTSVTGFPVPTGSQYFYCTLADAATQTTIEIVKVTAVSGTTFTIVRGQDGTTGTIFASGAVVSLRLVRASLQDFALLDEVNTFTQAQTFSVAPITSTLTGFIYGNGASAQTVATNAQLLTLLGTLPVSNGGTGLTTLTANYIPYGNGTSAFSSTSALQFNGSILGIGSAPSNWLANSNGVQFLNYGSIWNTNDPTIQVSVNGYFSAGSNWLYLSNGPATNYYQYNGFHIWRYAASGTAGNVISWAAAMQIGSTGGVSIGNTTDPGAGNLSVNGNIFYNGGYGSVAAAYGCRAWCNFNATGTPAIRSSGNCSSISSLGTGYWGVNLTNAMPDKNYSAVISAGYHQGATTTSYTTLDQFGNQTTSSIKFYTQDVASIGYAPDLACVAVFR